MEAGWTTITRILGGRPTQKTAEIWKKHIDGSSVDKGISYQTKARKWKGTIVLGRKCIHLGFFESEREAAEAYNAAAVEHYKEYAKLNELD